MSLTDHLYLALPQLQLVEPHCQVRVLQVLGAADRHLQAPVEHLETAAGHVQDH